MYESTEKSEDPYEVRLVAAGNKNDPGTYISRNLLYIPGPIYYIHEFIEISRIRVLAQHFTPE